jgi:hypothetical protein
VEAPEKGRKPSRNLLPTEQRTDSKKKALGSRDMFVTGGDVGPQKVDAQIAGCSR